MDPTKLTASDILNCTRPEVVFGFSDKDDAESNFKTLRRSWHPDRNKDSKATEVFCKLQELFDKLGSYLQYTTGDTTYTFKQRTVTKFPLGEVYHHEAGIAVVLDDKYVKYTQIFLDNVKLAEEAISKHESMKKDLLQLLPKVHRISNDSKTIVLTFEKGSVNLAMLVKSQKGALPPRVAAWIISRMLNYSMIYDFSGLVGNAISIDSFWVNTQSHSGFDLLGWFFAGPIGGKIKGLPPESVELYPPASLAAKVCDRVVDTRLIKKAGISMLGDFTGTGMKLKASEDLPVALVDWVRSMTSNTKKLSVYQNWSNEVLPAAFGKRSFFKWEIDPHSVFESNEV